jgi:hypothetical protein
VQAAGLVEHALLRAQRLDQARQQGRVKTRTVGQHGEVERQRLHGGGAANAAGAALQEGPFRQPGGRAAQVEVDLVRLHQVARNFQGGLRFVRFRAHAHARDLLQRSDHPLCPEQAQRQLEVVPGRAHHDAERRAAQAQLKRLLRGQPVIHILPSATAPAAGVDVRGLGAGHGVRMLRARPRWWWPPRSPASA